MVSNATHFSFEKFFLFKGRYELTTVQQRTFELELESGAINRSKSTFSPFIFYAMERMPTMSASEWDMIEWLVCEKRRKTRIELRTVEDDEEWNGVVFNNYFPTKKSSLELEEVKSDDRER